MSANARKITIATGAVIVGWIGSFAVAIWAASSHTTSQAEQTAHTAKAVSDHETRLRLTESKLGEVGTNMRWVIDSLARIEKRLDVVKP